MTDTAAPADNSQQPNAPREQLSFKVLGRTLEHFGVQMYKQRPAAIAELVANAWDAGAPAVSIITPDPGTYDRNTSQIVIRDSGSGMSFDDIKNGYLVLGRNRREVDDGTGGIEVRGRRVMGRKGIGKLAGFGIASVMTITTWQPGAAIRFAMDLDLLKKKDNEAVDVPLEWSFVSVPAHSPSGTEVTLSRLKANTPLDANALGISLARRFARSVAGDMSISVNGSALPDPLDGLSLFFRSPDDPDGTIEEMLPSGAKVKYSYAYSNNTIKEHELRGLTILVNGKVAQVPPYYFDVEGTASGQHATKYIVGTIEADFLDETIKSEDDIISTDRQEIDWTATETQELRTWGQAFARRLLADCTERRGKKRGDELILSAELATRISAIDKPSQVQVKKFLSQLGYAETADDRVQQLADSLVRAYEFRQFYDVTEHIEEVSSDPNRLAECLAYIRDWRVLEARAVLEIISGRLKVIETFRKLISGNAAETAHNKGDTNMHDAIGRFPWLLDPDYQLFVEEKSLTKILREQFDKDVDDLTTRERIDFLAVAGEDLVVIIEIKRQGHAVEYDEVERLFRYGNIIASHTNKVLKHVLICSGNINAAPQTIEGFKISRNFEIRRWADLFEKTETRYKHYRAILEGDQNHADFGRAVTEVQSVRAIESSQSVYRTPEERQQGLGRQDK